MKTHLRGARDGYAYCGASVTTNQLTRNRSKVTCKLCLTHTSPTPVTRGGKTKGRATATPKPSHWLRRASMSHNITLCGQSASLVQLAQGWPEVTCKACRRYGNADPSLQRPAPTASDSLIRRAFQEVEGELAVAIVEAEHALAEATRTQDLGEIIAMLTGALRRLVDLLNPPTQ